MTTFNAVATDPLAATDSAELTVSTNDASTLRTVRRTFMTSRVNWGSVIDESTWGPTLGGEDDFNQIMTGPITLGSSFTMMRDCNAVGVRLYKSPTAAGDISVGLWNSAGTQLAQKDLTWVSDTGGWQEVLFDAPVSLVEGSGYHWGYFYPNADTNYAAAIWVFQGQDTTNFPFWQKGYTVSGAGIRANGMWRHVGSEFTFANLAVDRTTTDYYIDPIVEWVEDTPGYVGGTDYFAQWVNSEWFEDNFPIVMFWPNVSDMGLYLDAGINLIATGVGATEEYINAFKVYDGDITWMPSLHDNDMSGPIAAQDDTDLSDIIIGYFVTDEPEFNRPFKSPDDTLTWRNNARKIDSSRIAWLNLSKMTLDNQGFIFAPDGVDMVTKELNIRRYASQSDIGSLDKYSLAAEQSYVTNTASGRPNRYGLWTYPLGISRMIEVTDGRVPVWGIVESTSEFPGLPTPGQVESAVWSMLIAGAKGIEYFDHRFADSDVSQDFGAFLRNPDMNDMITALNTRMQSMKNILFAEEANLVESYTSSGSMAFAQGGYAAGARVPMHYTSRLADTKTWIIAQSIRDGNTNATFFVPSLADATLTVEGEDRTIDIDGDGMFTDTFGDNYVYHIYSTDAAPTYSAPVNTIAPALSTDGTPQTGETIICLPGTWTGVPVPTFTFQWQRDGADISGATTASYVLVEADEGSDISCDVTATNTAGEDLESSNSVEATPPDAPVDSTAYGDALIDIDPTPNVWWRLTDLTDSSGNGFTLTLTGAVTDTDGLINDTDEGGKLFTNDTNQSLSVNDNTALRLSNSFTACLWMKPDFMPANFISLIKVNHYYIRTASNGKIQALIFTSAGYWDMESTSTFVTDDVVFVAVTFDGTTGRLYINGVEEDSVVPTGTLTTTASSVVIGKSIDDGSAGFYGTVDEVSIHDIVMTSGNISDLYDAGLDI